MSETVEEIKSGLTARALTLGIIILLIWTFFIILVFPFNLNAAFLWQQYGPQYEWPIQRNYTSVILFWAFVPFVLISLVNKKLRLTRQELLVIYTMIIVGTFAPGIQTSFLTLITGPGTAYILGDPYTEWVPKYIPSTWAPLDYDFYANSGFYDGGGSVPWGTWAPYLIFWIFFTGVTYSFFAFIGALTRKVFVDIEDLPFPGEVPPAQFIIDSTAPEVYEKGGTPLWKNKLLWLGFLVGFFGMIGLWLHYVYPASTLEVSRTFIDLTPMALIPWSALVFSLEPWAIGLALLVPLSGLSSMLVWGVILAVILPVIAVAAGWYPPFPTGTYANTLAWQGFLMPGANPEGWLPYGVQPILWGGLIALAVYPFWRHRTYIADSLRKAISGEEADGEVMSHRKLWVGAIVLGLIVWIMMMYQQCPWWLAIIVLLFTLFSEVGNTYNRGTVWPLMHKLEMMYWVAVLIAAFGIWGNVGVTGIAVAVIFMWTFIYHMAISIPTPQTVVSLKLAKMNKAKPLGIFISVIIASIIPFIINVILNLHLLHTGGALKGYAFGHWDWYGGAGYVQLGLDAGVKKTYTWWGEHAPGPAVWGGILFGFILTVILFVLRARYPKTAWFTAPGAVAVSWYVWTTGLMLPWIIGLIAKYLVLRIGGEKLFREKVIPLAVGFILGLGLVTFVSAWGYYFSHPAPWSGMAPE